MPTHGASARPNACTCVHWTKHAEFDGEDPHRYRPATAQCRRSLGRLYEEMHDDARAEEAYLASAAILRELCEDPFERCNHLRSLARTLVLLADLCERRGACGEAARYRTEAEALEAERGAMTGSERWRRPASVTDAGASLVFRRDRP